MAYWWYYYVPTPPQFEGTPVCQQRADTRYGALAAAAAGEQGEGEGGGGGDQTVMSREKTSC